MIFGARLEWESLWRGVWNGIFGGCQIAGVRVGAWKWASVGKMRRGGGARGSGGGGRETFGACERVAGVCEEV